jgi:hypothetical protein
MISEWQTSWTIRSLFYITHNCSNISLKISPRTKIYSSKSAYKKLPERMSGVNLIFII